MKHFLLLFFLAASFFACTKTDQSESLAVVSENAVSIGEGTRDNIMPRVLNNKLNYPWEILWGPDNFIWFTEREGRVNRMDPKTGQVIKVATIGDVKTTTPFNGLLGMVLHPDFSMHPYVFVVYNYDKAGQYLEKVVRFTYNGTTLTNPLIIVDNILGKIGPPFIHNGSRLVITPDMKLFISTGDANILSLPQDKNSLNGKILRVNLDGSIPADNPFNNAVWSTGQRNPQGMVYANGILYSSMHGLTTDDEINIIEKGTNYGWPNVEGYCNLPAEMIFCAANNIKEPIYAWSPAIAPAGIDFYGNDGPITQWQNSLLVAVLKDKKLIQLKLNSAGTKVLSAHEVLKNRYGRIRDVAISPDGKVYICTDNGDNKDMIVELKRVN